MGLSLIDRAVSGFPLSISTALAFESIFPPRGKVYDPDRVIPEKIEIKKYQELWINVDTLFRNLIQSASKEAIINTGYVEAAITLSDEMDTIISLLNNEGLGWCTAKFYTCNYASALSKYQANVYLRKDITQHQLLIAELKSKTFKELKKTREDIEWFSGDIKNPFRTRALMLSHIPYDLVSKYQFDTLDLLESNTGKCKTSREWNSKYYPLPGKDMSHLPFLKLLLLSLGDKALIHPLPFKLRINIHESSIKRKWTPLTTKDKVLLDLSLDIANPYDYAVIKSLS